MSDTKTIWLADEPVKYKISKVAGSTWGYGPGVHITRTQDADDNYQQAVLEIVSEGDTMRLKQWDGDLDAVKQINFDQAAIRYYPGRVNLWREIWKVALSKENE